MEGYTYYGDLLGISALYRLDPTAAYNQLDKFYNKIYSLLSGYCETKNDVSVSMFSDSMVIYGNETEKILEHLQEIYLGLIRNCLLIRGALVKGKLQFDPRITMKNFRKQLPQDDTLARAVSLASSQKGARLLIESALASELLSAYPGWLLPCGYMLNIEHEVPIGDVLRRISPTPDCLGYEMLYFWKITDEPDNQQNQLEGIRSQISILSATLSDEISIHYRETQALLERCVLRESVTKRLIPSHSANR